MSDSEGLHFTSLHFIKARAGQRTPAALSDSYTGPYNGLGGSELPRDLRAVSTPQRSETE